VSHDTQRKPMRLGLTGGIGSGKSTVANALQELGAQVVDADAVSRATTQANGLAMPEIARVFGSGFVALDGSLNRPMMRDKVFSDPSARFQLERIIHPLVAQEIATQIERSTATCLLFDVPLLVESPHWRKQLDWVWVVDCNESTQIERVQNRNGWVRDAVQAVIATQSPRGLRISAADAVIYNEGLSLMELKSVVKSLAAEFGL
jgi:dephospho-CoA kinase